MMLSPWIKHFFQKLVISYGWLFSSQSSNLSVHGSLSLITFFFCALIVSQLGRFVKGISQLLLHTVTFSFGGSADLSGTRLEVVTLSP
jgi:hypothetical protein